MFKIFPTIAAIALLSTAPAHAQDLGAEGIVALEKIEASLDDSASVGELFRFGNPVKVDASVFDVDAAIAAMLAVECEAVSEETDSDDILDQPVAGATSNCEGAQARIEIEHHKARTKTFAKLLAAKAQILDAKTGAAVTLALTEQVEAAALYAKSKVAADQPASEQAAELVVKVDELESRVEGLQADLKLEDANVQAMGDALALRTEEADGLRIRVSDLEADLEATMAAVEAQEAAATEAADRLKVAEAVAGEAAGIVAEICNDNVLEEDSKTCDDYEGENVSKVNVLDTLTMIIENAFAAKTDD